MSYQSDEIDKRLESIEPSNRESELVKPAQAEKPERDNSKDVSARKFVDDVLSGGAVLFHDQNNEEYIAIDGNGGNVSKIPSKSCRQWIALYNYKQFGKIVTTDFMNRVMQTLSAVAHFEGNQIELGVRIATRDNTLWYDLGPKAVSITNTGWQVIDQPPILFKRFGPQQPQVSPVPGGNLEILLKHVNVTERSEQILFLVYVVSAFIPNFPHPLLIFYGAQGAGKSTPMKMLKDLIDPSSLSGLSTPKNLEAFVQVASHNTFLFYDNLSKMPEWFSDSLARASTGESFSKRELYTVEDDVVYQFYNTIALNGINQVVSKPDLLDRSILLRMERIDPDRRKEFQLVMKDFKNDKPAILGAIFDTLSRAIALYPTVKLKQKSRMADYVRWGYAIAEAAGFGGDTFVAAYNQNIAIQHDEAIEANPLSRTIVELMEKYEVWDDTPASLFSVLDKIAFELQLKSSSFPKDAARLSKDLTTIQPNLLSKGIEIQRARGIERKIIIRKITDATDGSDKQIDIPSFEDRQDDGNDGGIP